jgi:hypothetical protein
LTEIRFKVVQPVQRDHLMGERQIALHPLSGPHLVRAFRAPPNERTPFRAVTISPFALLQVRTASASG